MVLRGDGILGADNELPGPAAQLGHGRWKGALDLLVTLSMLAVSVLLVWRLVPRSALQQDSSGPLLPVNPLPLAGAQIKGKADAPLGLIVYSDFQCPFCRKFAQSTLVELERQYVKPGLLLIAFRHMPLSSLHPGAIALAEGAACAGNQRQFWPMHDAIFAAKEFQPTELRTVAATLRLDLGEFDRCVDGQVMEEVRNDSIEASKLGLKVTPSMFLGYVGKGQLWVKRYFSGADQLQVFQSEIRDLLGNSR